MRISRARMARMGTRQQREVVAAGLKKIPWHNMNEIAREFVKLRWPSLGMMNNPNNCIVFEMIQ